MAYDHQGEAMSEGNTTLNIAKYGQVCLEEQHAKHRGDPAQHSAAHLAHCVWALGEEGMMTGQ